MSKTGRLITTLWRACYRLSWRPPRRGMRVPRRRRSVWFSTTRTSSLPWQSLCTTSTSQTNIWGNLGKSPQKTLLSWFRTRLSQPTWSQWCTVLLLSTSTFSPLIWYSPTLVTTCLSRVPTNSPLSLKWPICYSLFSTSKGSAARSSKKWYCLPSSSILLQVTDFRYHLGWCMLRTKAMAVKHCT